MSSDIVLTAAMRTNLLSLQNTQSLIDETQLRLATGLKVNSALDNPLNYFAAQSLNNRASDLTRLLDTIGQSIRAVEAADDGVTALTTLVDQAQSIVQSARDELAASEGEARIVGNIDLSNTATIVGGAISANDVIRIRSTDDDGNQISQDITITAGESAYSLAAKITNAFADNENGEVTAEVTDKGFFSIQSKDGRSFKVTAAAAGTDILVAGYDVLGIGDYFTSETRNGVALASSTVVAGNTVKSVSLYEASGDLVEAGDLLGGATASYLDSDGNTVFSGFAAGDTFTFTVDLDGTTVSASLTGAEFTAASTFQDLVDEINQDTTVNPYIELGFDNATGQITITSLSDSVKNVEITYTAAGATTFDLGFGDPNGALDPLSAVAASTYDTTISFNNSTQALDSLAKDYNVLRAQIDDIVKDASYRGINLLNGDNMTTYFNEDNTSSLTTYGATFTANGLGLTEASFRSASEIDLTAGQTREALNTIRNFGSSLSNSLAIIQARQDFTSNTITTLKAGADDLTVADQNEEGANLLALQTRQALGVTSLSLASQSQQSVLRLF